MVRLVILALLGLLILVLARPDLAGLDIDLPERDDLRLWIDAAGLLGPVLVVALMTLAIVASPLPSAPIALAAGAAYGHTYGTLLVVLGAEIGAQHSAHFTLDGSHENERLLGQEAQDGRQRGNQDAGLIERGIERGFGAMCCGHRRKPAHRSRRRAADTDLRGPRLWMESQLGIIAGRPAR